MNLAETMHFVNAVAPVDVNSGVSSDVWSMKNHSHATIIIQLGVTGGATTLTIESADDFTPSNTTALAFAIYKEETASGDTLGARTAVTTSGVALSTNDGVFYVVEVDAPELTAGEPNMRAVLSDPSGATFGSVLAILSGARYAQDQSATAIA